MVFWKIWFVFFPLFDITRLSSLSKWCKKDSIFKLKIHFDASSISKFIVLLIKIERTEEESCKEYKELSKNEVDILSYIFLLFDITSTNYNLVALGKEE